MMMILTNDDFAALSPSAKREIMNLVGAIKEEVPPPGPFLGEAYKNVDMRDVVDLTFKQIQTWMEAAAEKTQAGLRIFAEKGPVIRAKDLTDIGIDNLSHFQSRTTIRTRTVTGDKGAYLLGYDDWSQVDDGEGRYAVTPTTHASLRRYFQLD
jgi:hypothetical protein